MAELLHDLGIDPGGLVVNMVSFILLIVLMKRFMFGPVGAFLEARKRRIAEDLDGAAADRERASGERREIEARRSELLGAAETAASQVKDEATREAEEIRQTARNLAREIERSAHSATAREQREAAEALRNEVSDTAAVMCRQLLQGALTQERHRALMEELIADIERMAAEGKG